MLNLIYMSRKIELTQEVKLKEVISTLNAEVQLLHQSLKEAQASQGINSSLPCKPINKSNWHLQIKSNTQASSSKKEECQTAGSDKQVECKQTVQTCNLVKAKHATEVWGTLKASSVVRISSTITRLLPP